MGYKVLVIKLRSYYLFIEWDFNVECFGKKICVNFVVWVVCEYFSYMFLSRDG